MKSKSFIYFTIIFIGLFTACSSEDDDMTPTVLPTEELCLTMDENRTLVNRNDGVDYLLTCNLDFSDNVILTIEPGVVIEIENGLRIEITGQAAISAIGTAAAPIVFRGSNNAGQPSWKGILSDTSNPNNAFEHVVIEDGGTEDYFWEKAANLFVKEGMITITNCNFNNSGDLGLFLSDRLNESSNILAFENNHFTDNDSYGLLVSVEILTDISDMLNTCSFVNNGQQFIGVNADVFSSDFLSEDTHRWFSAPIPYLFLNEVRILDNSNLIIEAGTELVFTAGTYIDIGNIGTDVPSLAINGTAENPVIMRGETPVAGAWQGLHFKTNNIANQLTHLDIRHAEHEDYQSTLTLRGTGSTEPVSLTMDNVHIQEGNCGIYIGSNYAETNFTNVTYSNIVSEMCN